MTCHRSATPAAFTASRTSWSFPLPVRWTTCTPSGSSAATFTIARFTLRAPKEPPVMSRVCILGSTPNFEAAVRRADSRPSSVVRAAARAWMAGRRGRPVTTVTPCFAFKGVEGKVNPRADAQRAPTRLASPGRAFCSWMMIGRFIFRAARYAGVETYPPKPTSASAPLRAERHCAIARFIRPGREKNWREGLRGSGTRSIVTNSTPAAGTSVVSSP